MRSRSGPEMRLTYFFTSKGVQAQCLSGWPRWPQGQGFIAPTSVRRAGKVTDMAARAIVTTPSSSGCRRTSAPDDAIRCPGIFAIKRSGGGAVHPTALTLCPLKSMDAHLRGNLNGGYRAPLLLRTRYRYG